MRLLLPFLLIASITAGAQQIGQNKGPAGSETYTLSIKARLVIETVVAKDKKGNPIDDLTAKDFSLTEDGTPQTIRVFEHEVLPTSQTPVAPAPPDSERVKIYKRLARTQLAPETPGKALYSNRRFLALYFDMSAMRPDEQLRALSAAEKFIRAQMTPADLVSILRYSGGSVDVLQDFTDDHNKLLSILQTLIVGEGQGGIESIDDASSAIPVPPSDRMTANSTSSTPTASSPHCRPPPTCLAN